VGSQLIRVLGTGELEVVRTTAAEEDFDDPAVLTNAVKSVFSTYPAERRGLILWDHGGAWSGGFGGDEQNGTRAPQGMPFQTVAQAVRAGLTGAGVTAPLDFLAFDTCLLGSPEVASAFSGVANVYLADAEIDYGAGWDYTKTFTWLAAHPGASAAELARQEVAFWQAHHAADPVDVLFGSHVALDLTALPAFEASIAALVTSVQESAGAVPTARAFDLAMPDYEVRNLGNDTAAVPLKDVGQILTTLSKDPAVAVAKAASAASRALGTLVIARSNGAARVTQSGLNIGAGVPIAFTPALSARYRTLVTSWNTATKWADLIDHVRGAADAVGPVITSSGLVGRKVPFQVTDADLLSVEFSMWNIVANRSYMLQLLGATTWTRGRTTSRGAARSWRSTRRPRPCWCRCCRGARWRRARRRRPSSRRWAPSRPTARRCTPS
jgi:hypothetical protein